MVVYVQRTGDEQQDGVMLRHRWHLRDAVHRAQDTIDAHFVGSTGLTPLRYQQNPRVERAEHLIGQGATVEAAARAVGFGDARMLRRLRSRGKVVPS